MTAADSSFRYRCSARPSRADRICRSPALLAEARLHQLRRTRGQIAVCIESCRNTARISERRFLHALNYCMLLPDTRRSSSPLHGWLMHRTWGGIVAGGYRAALTLI